MYRGNLFSLCLYIIFYIQEAKKKLGVFKLSQLRFQIIGLEGNQLKKDKP